MLKQNEMSMFTQFLYNYRHCIKTFRYRKTHNKIHSDFVSLHIEEELVRIRIVMS